MNMRKRIERLEAQRPRNNTRLDALIWRVLTTFGADEREQRVLLDHADAVEAGLACGEPPEIVGAWRGIRPAGFTLWPYRRLGEPTKEAPPSP